MFINAIDGISLWTSIIRSDIQLFIIICMVSVFINNLDGSPHSLPQISSVCCFMCRAGNDLVILFKT